MGSTFGGLEIGKRMVSHETALNTTSHNISNADNPNYARQRVNMESMDPLDQPSFEPRPGSRTGRAGSVVTRIERVRDAFYDDQIIAATNGKHTGTRSRTTWCRWRASSPKPAGQHASTTRGQEVPSSWQDLANYPSERGPCRCS